MKQLRFYQIGFYISLFLFVATLTVLLASGWPGTSTGLIGQDNGGGKGFAHFRNKLGFDHLQQQQYDYLLDDYKGSTTNLKQQLQIEQEKMFHILAEGAVDTTSLEEISLKAAELQHMIRMTTFRHLKKVNAISNSEQRGRLVELYKNLMNESRPESGKGPGRNRMRHGQRNK